MLPDRLLVERLYPLGHLPFPGADRLAVDRGHGRLRAEGARQERLVRPIGLVEREVLLENRYPLGPAKVDHLLPCHPVHAVIPGRGPNLAPAHDEEVAGIGRVHKSMRVQHQRLVRARRLGLQAGDDAVQLGMRVQLGVLAVRQPAHLRHAGQPDARRLQPVHGARMLHDDHQRRPGGAELGVLERLVLDPARQHQAAMHIRLHPVGLLRRPHRRADTLLVHAHIERDRLAGVEEAVHVLIEKRPDPVIKPHPFPDTVPQHEARVIDRHFRLVAVDDLPVHIDADVAVADVLVGFMGRHGGSVLALSGAGGAISRRGPALRGCWRKGRSCCPGDRAGS